MTEPQLKLKEFITTKDILSKKKCTLHLMNNSLKRNTISELTESQPNCILVVYNRWKEAIQEEVY